MGSRPGYCHNCRPGKQFTSRGSRLVAGHVIAPSKMATRARPAGPVALFRIQKNPNEDMPSYLAGRSDRARNGAITVFAGGALSIADQKSVKRANGSARYT